MYLAILPRVFHSASLIIVSLSKRDWSKQRLPLSHGEELIDECNEQVWYSVLYHVGVTFQLLPRPNDRRDERIAMASLFLNREIPSYREFQKYDFVTYFYITCFADDMTKRLDPESLMQLLIGSIRKSFSSCIVFGTTLRWYVIKKLNMSSLDN